MRSPQLVLGVDVGGSKTLALVADDAEQVLGRAQTEGANWLTGQEAAAETLRQAIEHALQDAGVDGSHIVAVAIGSAGADRDTVASSILSVVRQSLGTARSQVLPDALLGLPAAGVETGVVIVAGTGSIAYGRNSAGRTARAGGWGYLLGDEGSGFDVGRQALAAALSARDGRSDGTLLVPALMRHFRLASLDEVVEAVYRAPDPRLAIAALAPLVGNAAAQGDQVALGILARAGLELGRAAGAVIRRLGMGAEQVTLVPLGSVFALGEPLVAPMLRVAQREAQVVLRWPEVEPARGAVRLACRLL